MRQKLFNGFCDLLYPHNCIICEKYLKNYAKTDFLCASCRHLFVFNRGPYCCSCPRSWKEADDRLLCPHCQEAKPHYNVARSALRYTPLLSQLIHDFKYGQKTFLRHFFADCLAQLVRTLPPTFFQSYDRILPVPLHTTRFRERGFNQAELLAQSLGRRLSLPVDTQTLIRHRATRFQATIHPNHRFTNLLDAFTITPHSNIRHASIILVDDLLTTGATASAAAKALKRRGARAVAVVTLALA